MRNPLKKILIALLILFFIPVGIISIYEVSKLDENEELISSIYKNQLESIVTSINSYTQDVADNWASRIELSVIYDSIGKSQILTKVIEENKSIKSIYLLSHTHELEQVEKTDSSVCSAEFLSTLVASHKSEINQLKNYYRNNYRKLIAYPLNSNSSIIYFITQENNGTLSICFIEINRLEFLHNKVGSRIQSIAQDNIVIALTDSATNDIILSSEQLSSSTTKPDFGGKLWLFPDILIQISLKHQSINILAKQRANQTLMLLGFVLLFLMVGVWFLYSSIKRELQLAQIKSEFISNVSHEIRTPLSLISMYIETLEMGRIKSAEKVNEYYQIINKETQRLIGMVNTILSFSKMENGKRQMKLETCNLNSICQNVLETYDFHFKLKDFDYKFTPDENIKNMNCDKEAVAEAIINLLDNAIKYSNEKKIIEIKTGIEKNQSFIEVKDYGMGISKKHQKLIFDKFYRVTHENLANKTKGTGLGLAIVNEIVKSHKGKITLQSKSDEGSSFRLYFPIIQNTIKN